MYSYIFKSIIFILGLVGTYLMIPLFKNLLVESNCIRPNYKGEMIPVSMGIVFLISGVQARDEQDALAVHRDDTITIWLWDTKDVVEVGLLSEHVVDVAVVDVVVHSALEQHDAVRFCTLLLHRLTELGAVFLEKGHGHLVCVETLRIEHFC